MIIQLPSGKCVELSVEQYLRMSEIDLKNLVAENHGEYYNDPFTHSVLYYGPSRTELEEDPEELIKNVTKELPDISREEKFNDKDFIHSDNIDE